jgi:hypothetical protein
MVLLQIKGAPPAPPQGLPPVAPMNKSGPPVTRSIAETDLLDKLGLGAWADVAVMSILALFLGVVLLGIMLWVIRKAFGSRDDMIKQYNDAERMSFDLITREASATARIAGLKGQISAVEANMRRLRGL